MTITVNGRPHEVDKEVTLVELLPALELPTKGVAVAIGGRIVSRAQWDSSLVRDGEAITLIQATCGG